MQNENSSRFSLFKLDHDLNHFARKIIIGSKIKIIFKTHIFLYETRNIFITSNENPTQIDLLISYKRLSLLLSLD